MSVENAYFAGGCFWGIEDTFMKTEGVLKTSVGYMGGFDNNPTYRKVCSGNSGHAETVHIEFSDVITLDRSPGFRCRLTRFPQPGHWRTDASANYAGSGHRMLATARPCSECADCQGQAAGDCSSL